LTKALERAQQARSAEAKRILELRRFFENEIHKRFPESTVNGSQKHRAPHLVNITFPGVDNERLMMELDEQGIQCAVGSACSASREEASHVLSAIGLSDSLARSTLRFSLGRFTTKVDLVRGIDVLARLSSAR